MLIILDRDGVINEDSDAFIKSPEEFIPIPGSLEAIAKLSKSGYTVLIATNQSGIARGLFNLEVLHAIHAKLTHAVSALGGAIGGIYYCPHGPEEGCECRKPRPGLLHAIANDWGPLEGVYLLGDSLRDLQAGMAAGCLPVLVKTGKGTKTLREHAAKLDNVAIEDDLLSFTNRLLCGSVASHNTSNVSI